MSYTRLPIDCNGREQTVLVTLSATPWVPLSPRLAVPDWATRALIKAPAGKLRYRMNGDPGGAPSSTPSAGGTLAANEMRVIGLETTTAGGRTLGFTSPLVSPSFEVEWLP